MKKCIILSDSFKGTLSSLEICRIARRVIPRIFPGCQVEALPVADGGEGTVTCFVEALGAQTVPICVAGPFGEPVTAAYCRCGDLAVIEMAAAAGLPLVGAEKDPEKTTSYGVGQLMAHAIDNGCTRLLLGLGGSCTNDGGCGCAAALGAVFRDADGAAFVPTGGTLERIEQIDIGAVRQRLRGVSVTVMCDVENPLHGAQGAAAIFAPQKGADEAMVRRLDRQLVCFDHALQRELGLSLAEMRGAGAAGGMGVGCVAFFGAELRSGIDCVLDTLELDARLDSAELVITGEGRIDGQSVCGKVISGVARRTAPRDIPLVAIAGSIGAGAESAYELGVTAMFATDRMAQGFPACAASAAENYERTLEDVLRLIRAARSEAYKR